MNFCGKCGTKVEDGIKFCPNCGAAVEAKAAPQPEPTPTPTPTPTPQPTQTQNSFENLTNMPDVTGQFDPKDCEQNKVMGILAYLSWLVIIPILAAKESKFARFHANQGLVLAIAEIAWWILTAVLTSILYAISWRLGSIISTIMGIVNILFFIFAILGIINAANGKAKELPVIGKFRILK